MEWLASFAPPNTGKSLEKCCNITSPKCNIISVVLCIKIKKLTEMEYMYYVRSVLGMCVYVGKSQEQHDKCGIRYKNQSAYQAVLQL